MLRLTTQIPHFLKAWYTGYLCLLGTAKTPQSYWNNELNQDVKAKLCKKKTTVNLHNSRLWTRDLTLFCLDVPASKSNLSTYFLSTLLTTCSIWSKCVCAIIGFAVSHIYFSTLCNIITSKHHSICISIYSSNNFHSLWYCDSYSAKGSPLFKKCLVCVGNGHCLLG